MNIQRFTAPTSREAMAKARNAFGDSAVILSTRSTDERLRGDGRGRGEPGPAGGNKPRCRAPLRMPSQPAAAPAHPLLSAPDSVEDDTEALSMSTLSFQDYVRERMLRKRRAAMQGDTVQGELPAPAPAAAPRQSAPRAEPIQVPIQRMNAPVAPPASVVNPMPAPIRTRAVVQPSWEDSLPPQPGRAHRRQPAWRSSCLR